MREAEGGGGGRERDVLWSGEREIKGEAGSGDQGEMRGAK